MPILLRAWPGKSDSASRWNKILPLIADFAAGTFSIIGTVSEAAVKVGLLVGAVKLLNLAGIEVLPILGLYK